MPSYIGRIRRDTESGKITDLPSVLAKMVGTEKSLLASKSPDDILAGLALAQYNRAVPMLQSMQPQWREGLSQGYNPRMARDTSGLFNLSRGAYGQAGNAVRQRISDAGGGDVLQRIAQMRMARSGEQTMSALAQNLINRRRQEAFGIASGNPTAAMQGLAGLSANQGLVQRMQAEQQANAMKGLGYGAGYFGSNALFSGGKGSSGTGVGSGMSRMTTGNPGI